MVAYAPSGVSAFGLSAVSGIFANRSHMGLPRFDFSVCSDQSGVMSTDFGMCLQVKHGPEAMVGADLVIVLPSDRRPLTLPAVVNRALADAHHRGALLAAYCSGTFLLAETGLLDGLHVTTNRHLSAFLAQRHPGITVESDALFVDQGQIVTGAGAAAGIDMCLHLLRREHGAAVSNAVARDWMVSPRRESGQAQYVPSSTQTGTRSHIHDEDKRLADLLVWARARLSQPLTVNELAREALMSARTFARRFQAVIGTTPYAWLTDQRLDLAEELLETTTLSIREVAGQAGFRSNGVLRTQFVKRHGISPTEYRQRQRFVDEMRLFGRL
ncbi:transcriptional regulator GlxA family with amidase domain [Nonomuraea thailandensis]|uniref:Transcriptional regulator GlxA family with amidase domain n=1 Tax=Nonomuraea thailandensis TaxID=1188745 RepID=A0A9X2G7M5_9ACTN|nr:helix-turn-helix domain-containing protein [Nonomuraea thailandensis]MCP2353766.1 transcriptional regulator GlxA family with amidase domain [Nonomuraea thailandensis]